MCITITTPDLHTVNNCLYGLYNLIDNQDSNGIIHFMVESGAASHIIKIIGYNPSLINIIIKIIGNMLTGDSQDVTEMHNFGVLNLLEYLYRNNTDLLYLKEILWAISNITAGNQQQINAFMQSDLLGLCLDKIKTTKNTTLMIDLVWIFSNAITGGGIEIACKFIEYGIIEIYLYIIESFNSEIVIMVTLEGIRNLFKYGELVKILTTEKNIVIESFCKLGGISYLEKLALSNRSEIVMKVEQIIQEYLYKE